MEALLQSACLIVVSLLFVMCWDLDVASGLTSVLVDRLWCSQGCAMWVSRSSRQLLTASWMSWSRLWLLPLRSATLSGEMDVVTGCDVIDEAVA